MYDPTPRRHLTSTALCAAASLWLAALPALGTERPLFDVHLHYNAEHSKTLGPGEIVQILTANAVDAAVVTSRPPELVLDLHRAAPERILPFLGVYTRPADKATWSGDAGLPVRVERALTDGPWRGIGELHLFAEQRHSPVFHGIAALAEAHELPLQLHTDPVTIDTVFEVAPEVTVLWAHAGAYPYPPLLRDYLDRYPGLYIDLSVRDGRIAPGGHLDPEWELLFLEYPDRFLVGVDTFSTGRWESFASVSAQIRSWLDQLPRDVAERLACRNAAGLFSMPTCDPASP